MKYILRSLIILSFLSSFSFAQNGNYKAKDIKVDIFKLRNYSQNGSFNSDAALKFLFPGNYYYNETGFGSGTTISCWRTSKGKKIMLNGGFDKEEFQFPEVLNATIVLGTLDYNQENDNYKLLFFNSNNGEFTGRYMGGTLGAAKFKYENNNWILTLFDPAIDCLGNWSAAPMPDNIIKITAVSSAIMIGGSGEGGVTDEEYKPVYGYLSLYSEENTKFEKVFDVGLTGCKNAFGNFGTTWKSTINTTNTNTENGYYDILLETTGNADKRFMDIDNLPDDKIKEYAQNHSSFNFALKRKYIFENGAYLLKDKEVVFR